MKSFKALVVALFAVLALGAIVASAASAAEVRALVLSGGKFPVKFEGTSGAGKLESVGGSSISCTAGTNKGEITNEKTGTVTFDFTGCKAFGFNCNTTGDATGVVLTTGTFEGVYDSLGTTLLPALFVTLKETTIECTALAKVKVRGTLLLLFSKLTSGTDVTEAEIIVTQSKGVPTDKKYWKTSEEKTAKEAKLESSFDGGAFEESGEESSSNKVKYSEMVALDF